MKTSHTITSALAILVLTTIGCGGSSLAPIQGSIELGSDIGGGVHFQFNGDTLEIRSKEDPREIAFASISPDGTFSIESLKGGQILRGANPGDYEARIIIADDDSAHRSAGLKAIPKKYLRFETSGLNLSAPSNDVKLTITR